MSIQEPCPSKNILVGFVSGDLPEPDAKTLESHLSECDACGDTVRAMHATDTMVNFVRSAGLEDRCAEQLDRESSTKTVAGGEKQTPARDDVDYAAKPLR